MYIYIYNFAGLLTSMACSIPRLHQRCACGLPRIQILGYCLQGRCSQRSIKAKSTVLIMGSPATPHTTQAFWRLRPGLDSCGTLGRVLGVFDLINASTCVSLVAAFQGLAASELSKSVPYLLLDHSAVPELMLKPPFEQPKWQALPSAPRSRTASFPR